MRQIFYIKYGFQKGSHKIEKKCKIHTIREDVKKLKYVKTFKMYKILTQIQLIYKFKNITLNKTTTTLHRFHRPTCTNQRNDVRFSKLNVVVLLQSKGT